MGSLAGSGRTIRVMTLARVHGREVLSSVGVGIVARLMQESAIPVIALLTTEERRTILRRAILRPTAVD